MRGTPAGCSAWLPRTSDRAARRVDGSASSLPAGLRQTAVRCLAGLKRGSGCDQPPWRWRTQQRTKRWRRLHLTRRHRSPLRGAASDTGLWQKEIDVRDFIQQNYQPYDGDESFLAGPTARTQGIWDKLNALFLEERRKGVLDVSQVPSSITAHAPGYIDREHEVIVGLQTEAPLKRAIMPNGGFRMVASALKAYGYTPDPARRRGVHEVPEDAQRRGVRRLHRRHPPLPQLAHPHRPAGCVRPRPDHRRLPARRAVWRAAPHRPQAGGEGRPRRGHVERCDHPRSRGAGRADPRAQGAAADGRELRLRHLAAGGERARRPSSGSTSRTWPR